MTDKTCQVEVPVRSENCRYVIHPYKPCGRPPTHNVDGQALCGAHWRNAQWLSAVRAHGRRHYALHVGQVVLVNWHRMEFPALIVSTDRWSTTSEGDGSWHPQAWGDGVAVAYESAAGFWVPLVVPASDVSVWGRKGLTLLERYDELREVVNQEQLTTSPGRGRT